MIIHRERFEAWLFSQPDDRQYNYTDAGNCLICMFFRETTNIKSISVTARTLRISKSGDLGIHPIAYNDMQIFEFDDGIEQVAQANNTFKRAKYKYAQLFGHPYESKSEPVNEQLEPKTQEVA